MGGAAVVALDRGWDILRRRADAVAWHIRHLGPWLERASDYQRATVGWRFFNQTGLDRAPWPKPAKDTPKNRVMAPGKLGAQAAMADTLLLARGWATKRSGSFLGTNPKGGRVHRVVQAGDAIRGGEVPTLTMWVTARNIQSSGRKAKDVEVSPGVFESHTEKGGTRTFPYGWWLQNRGRGSKTWEYYFFSERDADYHVHSLSDYLTGVMNEGVPRKRSIQGQSMQFGY